MSAAEQPQTDATIGAPTVGATAHVPATQVPATQPGPPPDPDAVSPGTVTGARREDHIELYRGHDQDWYWRRRAGNGEIVATGGEGYSHRIDCVEAAQRVNGPLLLIEAVSE